jgi:hypothetical protein
MRTVLKKDLPNKLNYRGEVYKVDSDISRDLNITGTKPYDVIEALKLKGVKAILVEVWPQSYSRYKYGQWIYTTELPPPPKQIILNTNKMTHSDILYCRATNTKVKLTHQCKTENGITDDETFTIQKVIGDFDQVQVVNQYKMLFTINPNQIEELNF